MELFRPSHWIQLAYPYLSQGGWVWFLFTLNHLSIGDTPISPPSWLWIEEKNYPYSFHYEIFELFPEVTKRSFWIQNSNEKESLDIIKEALEKEIFLGIIWLKGHTGQALLGRKIFYLLQKHPPSFLVEWVTHPRYWVASPLPQIKATLQKKGLNIHKLKNQNHPSFIPYFSKEVSYETVIPFVWSSLDTLFFQPYLLSS